jgi:diguanylate cyclase (GGDEF)-like protein
MLGIDGFRKLNEACGRRVGDLALSHVARVMEQNLRRSDLLSRWAGDEFLAWLPSLSGTAALAIAEQLRAGVAGGVPQDVATQPVGSLRISVGATPVPSTDTFSAALDRVRRAMLRAKQNGGNCVVVARPGA